MGGIEISSIVFFCTKFEGTFVGHGEKNSELTLK